jgi:hypothetical protein
MVKLFNQISFSDTYEECMYATGTVLVDKIC